MAPGGEPLAARQRLGRSQQRMTTTSWPGAGSHAHHCLFQVRFCSLCIRSLCMRFERQHLACAVMISFTSDTSSLKVLTHLVNAICLPPERMPYRHLCGARVHAMQSSDRWFPCCSGSDEEEDAEAKAQRLSERLRPATGGSASAATRSSAGAAAQQTAQRADPPQTEALAPPDGMSTHAAQTPHGNMSSGRISLGGAIGAAQRKAGTSSAPQTAAADVPNVLSFVRKQQASVADRDWLFGGAGDGPGDDAEVPEQTTGERSAAASGSQRARRESHTTPSSSTEHREFIRAKKFSGEESIDSLEPAQHCHRCSEQLHSVST